MEQKKAFSTTKLDEILRDRSSCLEQQRVLLLNKVQEWLNKFSASYGIEQAYIFGSILRSGHFHEQSDIDIAVVQINPEDYFTVISLLQDYLGREVDVIMLNHCYFAQKIRDTGLLWIKTP
ncbi:MAG: nucleotidyltransferase domain-containing protein [Gloeocapsa sp. DLM2.Bin57]|nr:MAG: nucleotidyltransferase domain-containing protein [Gloeocapsa sp. DLM2.Bin57]